MPGARSWPLFLLVVIPFVGPTDALANGGPEVRIIREREGVRVEVRTRVRSAPRITVGPAKQPFEFASSEPLALAPDDLDDGEKVEVHNNRAVVLNLDVQMGDLTNADGGRPVTAKDLAMEPKAPDRLELPAAGTASVSIGPAPEDLPSGEYSGWLTVSDTAGDSVARRALSLTVPGEDAALSPKPRTDKLKIAATRCWFWKSDCARLSGDELPLDLPADTAKEMVKEPASPLGYLNGPSGTTAVKWGETGTLAGGLTAGLTLEGLGGSDDYEGTISLLERGDEEGDVAIELAATDLIVWPIIALLFGILGAFMVERWVNVRRVATALGERLSEIVATFRGAEREFSDWTAGKPYAAYTISSWFNTEAASAKAALDDLGSLTLDGPKHDAVTARIGGLREIAVTWSDFGEQLIDLDQRVGGLPLNDAGALPAVHGTTSPLLVGGPFADYQAYDTRLQEVAEGVQLLSAWSELREHLVQYEAWAAAIDSALPADDAEGRAKLQDAEEKLDGVRSELWMAANAGDLETFQTEEDLLQAEQWLSELSGALPAAGGGPESAPSPTPAGGIAAMGAAAAGTPTLSSTAPDWSALAKELRTRRLMGDAIVALVAMAVAVVTALTTLYFGETFGGWDYAVALAWGLATEGALTLAVAAFGRIGQQSSVDRATVPQLAVAPS